MVQKQKGSKPAFIARAKQAPESEFMVNIGAAWPWKNGDGFVVHLNQVPVQWDGSFILSPPKADE